MTITLTKYLTKNYLKAILVVSFAFACLSVILNLFEEQNFFKDHSYSNIFLPLLMSLLKTPEILYSLFPFVILVSSIFVFLQLSRTNEIIPIKTAGKSNLNIISLFSIITFLIGVLLVVGVTPVTSILTEKYLEVKSSYTKNNDYLAAITSNGIWIKEKKEKSSSLIRAKQLKNNKLIRVSLYQFDEKNNLIARIESEDANIKTKKWRLNNVVIYRADDNNSVEKIDTAIYQSAYDAKSIKNIYANINTVSFWKIKDVIELYKKRGYSTAEYEGLFQKSLAFPFFLLSMVFLAAVGIFSTGYKGNFFYYITFSIFSCVFVYYFNDFSQALGQTGKLPITVSIWMPVLVIFIFSSIGLIRVQQK